MILHKELMKQTVMEYRIKLRFEHSDGSYEELRGEVIDGLVFKGNNKDFLNVELQYENLMFPDVFAKFYIGIRDNRTKEIRWFEQGKYRFDSKYGFVNLEESKINSIGYKREDNIVADMVLDDEFIRSILIKEGKDNSDTKDGELCIITKLCPFANKCKEISYQKENDDKICTYEIKTYTHDLGEGTTFWNICKKENDSMTTEVKEAISKEVNKEMTDVLAERMAMVNNHVFKDLSIITIKKELMKAFLDSVKIVNAFSNNKIEKVSDYAGSNIFNYLENDEEIFQYRADTYIYFDVASKCCKKVALNATMKEKEESRDYDIMISIKTHKDLVKDNYGANCVDEIISEVEKIAHELYPYGRIVSNMPRVHKNFVTRDIRLKILAEDKKSYDRYVRETREMDRK